MREKDFILFIIGAFCMLAGDPYQPKYVSDAIELSPSTLFCNPIPTTTSKSKTSGDNGFRIEISGNPTKYVPGETYTGKLTIFLFSRHQENFFPSVNHKLTLKYSITFIHSCIRLILSKVNRLKSKINEILSKFIIRLPILLSTKNN